MENKRLDKNIRKHFLTVQVMEHWNRMPREVLKSLLKNHLDVVLGNLLLMFLPEQRLDQMDPDGSFPSQPFCNPVILQEREKALLVSL